MQKGSPLARLSSEENKQYAAGYAAGFQAGQQANRDRGVQQNMGRSNGQPFTSTVGNQRSQSPDYKEIQGTRTIVEPYSTQGKKLIKTGRLSQDYPIQKPPMKGDLQFRSSIDHPNTTRGVPTRRSIDDPTSVRGTSTQRQTDYHNATRSPPIQRTVDHPTVVRGVPARRSIDDPNSTRVAPTQRAGDYPPSTRGVYNHAQDHEMPGKTTEPDTEVQFTTRGHY